MILDVNEMAAEYIKAEQDKSRIYFIEKYLSTFNASKGKKTPFKCFPRQKAFLRALATNKNVVAIKPRQCGITTLSSAYVCAQCTFASEDAPETVLCVGNKLDLANQLITKIRDFLIQVPRWYWGEEYYSPDPKSDKNLKSIFVKDSKSELQLFNGCRIVARSSGENASRGISAVSVLVLDEAAFIENGPAVYATCAATMASNPNAKTIMVSTPNGHDELYYTTYKQALAHENNFTAVQFRWYQDPRYNKFLKWYKKDKNTGKTKWTNEPTINNEGDIKYDEEHWEELVRAGYKPTSPWYEDMCKSFNNDSVKIAQELDVSFQGSANNVVAPEFIDMQNDINVREPLDDFKDPLNEDTWFWKKPIDGHRYVMGIDPSRGISADRTAIEIVDMDGRDENGLPIIEQVAEYVGKKLGDDIGGMAHQYGKLYNDAYIVVDCTGGCGDALILTLIQLGYKNLYYEDANQKTYTVQNQTEKPMNFADRLPGFHFQGNRYPVLAGFAGMVRSNEFKIRSRRVTNELDTWIFDDSGRMDHQSGAHDDTICSLAMALFVMKYTYNKLWESKKKDEAILKSYMIGGGIGSTHPNNSMDDKPITPQNGLPFYNQNTLKKTNNGMNQEGSYLWLFSGYY
jgi:hypothetical protein